ncbi:guanine nucleotide-binding protein alpha-2 subunit [Schizopora paradoxa]|uniref:Guanine nucleotide-binding protein alpha-2 subunit n=1 Tax=Schizopora paradoxa TaxID=27342 RepID=A0A0H2S123_9AGAM|nr:guanine nucleotide-binding protein alpha-2 subunit [Schizopora paradoxa]
MGACVSSAGGVSEEEKAQHREAEKQMRDHKAKLEQQVKVLLLGSGDSGKSTILKQMRLIHDVNFSAQEQEFYRQLVFANLTQGMKSLLDALEDMDLQMPDDAEPQILMIENAPDIKDGQPFPPDYLEPLRSLWADPTVQKGLARGNEAALPDNLTYFYSDLDRLFASDYHPTEQDIIRCKARTVGITETVFKLRSHEMLMVDVGGQKSERRKWIHCFQDVTTILFLVSLSGYDQCLVEDKDANQMQDAMTIWDSICHSQWFRNTSIILFLNKDDIFKEKIAHSNIKTHFPDYEGEPGNVQEGREYFRQRFTKLSRKSSGQAREREIYVHFTNATDTALLRVVMAAVEGTIISNNIRKILL